MKKILFSAISALAVAGVASAADSTQFGVLKVSSSAAETIVSVPWLASGTGTADVKVADLVLTSGLNVGDELKYYNDGSYQCWRLVEDPTTKVKSWEAATNLNEDGSKKDNPTEDVATLACGKAIILKRGAPIVAQFYIMGKPYSAAGQAISIPEGSLQKPVYSLVAPPTVVAVDVNTGITWTGVGEDDMMIMSDGNSLLWGGEKDKNWYKRVNNVWTKDNITIPAGTGAWFVSKTNGNKTFTIK